MSAPKCKLRIEVLEVKGHCPIYKPGDYFIIDMPQLITANNPKICIHAFIAMQTLIQALARCVSAKELGIGPSDNVGYVQCPDPGPPYTSGGTVIFRITRENP